VRDLLQTLREQLSTEFTVGLLQGAVILVLGFFLAAVARRTARRLTRKRLSLQSSVLAGRMAYYGILILVAVPALRKIGVDLSLLLGAAGVLTVAIGFAAQTATSNLISGLFLIGERPFEIGDTIRVDATTGEVLSIDLLSVRLRTFDNLLVRLPNEVLLKSQITNLTRFPIRRFDLQIGVAYKEDLRRVETLLREVADADPTCLDEPKPLFQILGFGESAVDLQFSVWCVREKYLQFKTAIQRQIKEALDAAGIEIPFPHRTLYAGSLTDPFPVRAVGSETPSAVGPTAEGA
jgi:small-conductance mechanosensitive channel